jgi:sugar phosphate permease
MRRSQVAVIAALLVAYASLYLCRANVDAALPFLAREGYTKTHLGLLSSAATLSYAIGKVVMGGAGDAIGGRRLMLVAVAGSVVCSLAFGASHAFAAFVVLAAANRFFQAGGWPGLVQVVSRRFEPARHGRIMGILSTSYELGNVGALTFSGLVVRLGWRALFVVNPLALALVGGAAVLSLPTAPDEAPQRPSVHTAEAQRAQARDSLATVLPRLFRSGPFLATVVLSALLTFIRIGFLTWTPTYLAEISRATSRAEISGAIVKTAMFPAAGVVAALSFGFITDRFGPGRRAPVMAGSLAFVVVLVLMLAHGGLHDQLSAALLIAGIGLFLLGPYSLLAGALALDAAGTQGAATAAGIIDGAGYLGATASGSLLGYLADRAGWSAAFDVIAAAAALATLISAAWAIVIARR